MIRQTKLSLSNSPKTLSSLVLRLLHAELNNLLLDLLVQSHYQGWSGVDPSLQKLWLPAELPLGSYSVV